jgi:hypothetical protein
MLTPIRKQHEQSIKREEQLTPFTKKYKENQFGVENYQG